MSDLPDLPYTVNDPSSVECPHCHGKMDLSEFVGTTLDTRMEWGGDCELCGRYIQFEMQHSIIVLAWKPGEKE